MKLIQCDRCGGNSNYDMFSQAIVKYYAEDKYGKNEKIMDICEKCKDAFLAWLKGESK